MGLLSFLWNKTPPPPEPTPREKYDMQLKGLNFLMRDTANKLLQGAIDDRRNVEVCTNINVGEASYFHHFSGVGRRLLETDPSHIADVNALPGYGDLYRAVAAKGLVLRLYYMSIEREVVYPSVDGSGWAVGGPKYFQHILYFAIQPPDAIPLGHRIIRMPEPKPVSERGGYQGYWCGDL